MLKSKLFQQKHQEILKVKASSIFLRNDRCNGKMLGCEQHAEHHGLEKAFKDEMPILGGSRHSKFLELPVYNTCLIYNEKMILDL